MRLKYTLAFLLVILAAVPLSAEKQRDRDGQGIEKRFAMMDKNGDGKLSADEFKRPEMLQRMDRNNDGFVTLEEARQNFDERHSINFEERLKLLDTNNDGKLSRDEFKKPELFDKLDANKDGFVTLEEAKNAQSKFPSSDRKKDRSL